MAEQEVGGCLRERTSNSGFISGIAGLVTVMCLVFGALVAGQPATAYGRAIKRKRGGKFPEKIEEAHPRSRLIATAHLSRTAGSMSVSREVVKKAGRPYGSSSFVPEGSKSFWTSTGALQGGNVYSLAPDNSTGYVYAGTDSGVFRSNTGWTSWSQVAYGTSVQSIAVGTNGYVFAGTSSGVYVSTDEGVSWPSTALTYNILSLVVLKSGVILAGTFNNGIYSSTDNGVNWQQIAYTTGAEVYSLAVDSSGNLFAGTYDPSYSGQGGVYRSTDYGQNWYQVGLPDYSINALTVSPSGKIFAGTESNGVYASTDNGTTWTAVDSGLTTQFTISLATNLSGDVFVGTDGAGVFESTDGGSIWTATGPGDETFWSVAVNSAGYAFAGGDNNDVYRTSNPTTSSAPPPAPALAGPANGSTGISLNATLTWDASPGATSYGFQIALDSNFSNISDQLAGLTGLTNTESGLSSATTYYWHVDATDSVGTSPWSPTWHFTTVGGPSGVPSVPNLVSPANGQANLSTSLRFTWNPSAGAVSYDFQIATDTAFTNVINDVGGLTVPTDTVDTGLSPGTTYYWRVDAADSAGTSQWSQVWQFTTANSGATISPPTLASPLGSTGIWIDPVLSWNSSPGATGYEIQVSTDSTFSTSTADISGLATTSFKVTGLNYGTTYYWRAEAMNYTEVSNWSSYASFTTLSYPSTIQVSFQSNQFFPTNDRSSTGYRMLGLPGNVNIRLGDVLSGKQKYDWDAYYDNGASQNYYVEYDGSQQFAFQPGLGFWILSVNPFTVDQSVSTVQLDTDACYSIPLHSGWNVISDPFTKSVSWSSVQTLNGTSQALFSFNGGFQQTSTLAAYQGYYFYADAGLSALRVPYVSVPSAGAASPLRNIPAKALTATLSDGSRTWSSIRVGVSDPQNGKGRDIFAPPGNFEEAGMCVIDSSVTAGWKDFAQDFRDSIGTGQAFDFRVTNRTGKALSLKFNPDNGLSGYRIYLVDRDLSKAYNLRDTSEITIPSFNKVKNYTVLIGDKSFVDQKIAELVPRKFVLYQNYPNPFNPTTVIRFEVPAAGRVNLTVYDALGRKVETLMDANVAPGYYEVPFDGSKYASGVYFYRISTGSNARAMKMMLLK